MSHAVDILICYKAGTAPVLAACLEALARHRGETVAKVYVAYLKDTCDPCEEMAKLGVGPPVGAPGFGFYGMPLDLEPLPGPSPSLRIHGRMLDEAVKKLRGRCLLTLDSDSIVMADRWLDGLVWMLEHGGAACAGILHPWSPPPPDMDPKSVAYRLRSQHCTKFTHVACQLIERSRLLDLGVKFDTGDDTGLAIPAAVIKNGGRVDGYHPTRCPAPDPEAGVDPELNRYVCVVYGDAVCHLGGYTRVAVDGDAPVMDEAFGWARDRIIAERSAKWLVEDASLSHVYLFDREEEAFAHKMDMVFGMRGKGIKPTLPEDAPPTGKRRVIGYE